MNIQIYAGKKNFDTQKAERYFKERRIAFQRIDLLDKGMSRGELQAVCRAVGGLQNLLDAECRDQDTLALVRYLADDAKLEKVLENQQILRSPIVRNGKLATVGYQPDVWKTWT